MSNADLWAVREAPISTPDDIDKATTADPDEPTEPDAPETLPQDPIFNDEDEQ